MRCDNNRPKKNAQRVHAYAREGTSNRSAVNFDDPGKARDIHPPAMLPLLLSLSLVDAEPSQDIDPASSNDVRVLNSHKPRDRDMFHIFDHTRRGVRCPCVGVTTKKNTTLPSFSFPRSTEYRSVKAVPCFGMLCGWRAGGLVSRDGDIETYLTYLVLNPHLFLEVLLAKQLPFLLSSLLLLTGRRRNKSSRSIKKEERRD